MGVHEIVVDAHFHHVPVAVYEKLEALISTTDEGRRLQAKCRDPAYAGSKANLLLRDLEATIRYMDDVGVDIAMLQMPSWSVAKRC